MVALTRDAALPSLLLLLVPSRPWLPLLTWLLLLGPFVPASPAPLSRSTNRAPLPATSLSWSLSSQTAAVVPTAAATPTTAPAVTAVPPAPAPAANDAADPTAAAPDSVATALDGIGDAEAEGVSPAGRDRLESMAEACGSICAVRVESQTHSHKGQEAACTT